MTKSFLQLFEELADRLVLHDVAARNEILGCTADEVREVAESQRVRLPSSYEALLFVMGRGAGRFFRGTDFFYPKLLQLREFAENLLEEEKEFELPAKAFVFLCHQGYQFMYFHTGDDEEDPSVFYYLEGEGKSIKKADRFSVFIRESVDEHIAELGSV